MHFHCHPPSKAWHMEQHTCKRTYKQHHSLWFVCVCACVRTYVRVGMRVYVYVCVIACGFTFAFVCALKCVYKRVCVCLFTSVCVSVTPMDLLLQLLQPCLHRQSLLVCFAGTILRFVGTFA